MFYHTFYFLYVYRTPDEVAQQGKTSKYAEEYLTYEFTPLIKEDFDVPQCVICFQTLSDDATRQEVWNSPHGELSKLYWEAKNPFCC